MTQNNEERVTPMLHRQMLYRIRKAHKHITDEDFAQLLKESTETGTTLTRGMIEQRGLQLAEQRGTLPPATPPETIDTTRRRAVRLLEACDGNIDAARAALQHVADFYEENPKESAS